MFNGVRGEGIKKFFEGRKGRNLKFASDKPIKVQAGAKIVEIATSAIDQNTDNLIISSLKATIEDLKMQLAVKKDPVLQAKLDWATEYLSKFEKEIKTIKESKKSKENKKEHELKTILRNIKLEKNRVVTMLNQLPFVVVKDDFDKTKLEIEKINEQFKLYEQSVKAYEKKGGVEDYEKIALTEKKLTVIYKVISKKIEELKDELKEATEEKYMVKENLAFLERFVDDLEKMAESPAIYQNIRMEIDKKNIEENKKTKTTKPKKTKSTPVSHKDAVDAYEAKLNELNKEIEKLNKYIEEIESLITNSGKSTSSETNLDKYKEIDENIKQSEHRIESLKVTLASMRKEGKDKYQIDISKLTSVKKIPTKKIEYKIDYETYITALDRESIKATTTIQNIALSKSEQEEAKLNELNANIIKIYQGLLALNSIINRRIVVHSKENHKNINELNNERLTKRKEIIKEFYVNNIESTLKNNQGKSEQQLFEEKLNELSSKWLKAIRTAAIDRAGHILLDEEPFAKEMTSLIAHSHTDSKIKAVMTASEKFNKERQLLIKEKRNVLNKFRQKITNRIKMIFQSGTISNNIEKGIDYNEWLTEVEYSELILLSIEPEYKEYIPNSEELIKGYISEQETKYQGIKKKQQSDIIENLSVEFAELISNTETIPVNENFEENIIQIFKTMKEKYQVLKEFDYELNIEHNFVTVSYNATKYEFNSGAYTIIPQKFEHVIMSQKKYIQYLENKKSNEISQNIVQTNEVKEKNSNPEISIRFSDDEVNNAKVSNRKMTTNPARIQKIDRAKATIMNNIDSLTIRLIKQGLRIKYNENLRDQLRQLNAKLSLVNKNNTKISKDIKFQGEELEQDLAFKTEKEEFNIEDYKLDVRIVDEDKKYSDLLYSADLEKISEELHGKTK